MSLRIKKIFTTASDITLSDTGGYLTTTPKTAETMSQDYGAQLAQNAKDIDGIVYEHVRGDAEFAGNSSSAHAGVAMYEQMAVTTLFNHIELPVWEVSGSAYFEWKVFIRDAVAAFNPSTVIADASGALSVNATNKTSAVASGGKQRIYLGKTLSATVGKYVYVCILTQSPRSVNYSRWTEQSAVAPLRHSFYIWTTNTWDATLARVDPPGYGQPAIRLLNTADGLSAQTINRFTLPPKIYGTVGKEINIYFDNIIDCDAADCYFDVTCSIGTQQNERWTCVPAAAGSFVLTIDIFGRDFVFINRLVTSVVVSTAETGTGVDRRCLFIGDSLTYAGTYTQELLTLFGETDPMNINLIGTIGTAPNVHEGRSGWTILQFYSDATSPFVTAGVFNFAAYMTANGYSALNYVGILIGVNDVFSYTDLTALETAVTTMMTNLNAMVLNIHTYDAAIKIGIMVNTPPSASQDAFGKNYTSVQNKAQYKQNIIAFSKRLIDKFANREAEKVYLVPVNVNLDTVHNMSTETVAVNSRNSTTVVRQANGVHPASSGYYQIADAIYYWLHNMET